MRFIFCLVLLLVIQAASAQKNYVNLEYSKGLLLDLYLPESTTNAPIVVLMHGGGFLKGSKEQLANEAKLFVEQGFAVASINYTLGKDCSSDSLALEHAVLRARNNMVEAVNFLVDHKADYHLNSDWVFLGGQSAGAITSLAVAYLNDENLNRLGPPETYTLSTLKAPIKGIYNNWGAAFPFYFDQNAWVPLVSFHGVYDSKVPAGKGLTNSCVNRLEFWGAMQLAELARKNNWSCSTTMVNSDAHGVLLNEKETRIRVERTAQFFKELMRGASVFEEFKQ